MLDFYQTAELFTTEERQSQASLRRFLDAEVLPHIGDWWEQAKFPRELVLRFGEMGLLGPNLSWDKRSAVASNVAYGLMMYELERIDSGLRSFVSVQGALAMYVVTTYGSDEQRRIYLPELAAGRIVGCFGLTEAHGGSDPAAMKTIATKDGAEYVLRGSKSWITSGGIADIAIVWARDDEGEVRGFIVPTDAPGFSASKIERKMSLRVCDTSELVMDGVRVKSSQMLPGACGMSAPLSALTQGRYGIVWGVMGALEAVYGEALEFAKSRSTFGRPIASRQLVQAKLAGMLSDHTQGMLLAWRLGHLKDSNKLAPAQVSMAKRFNVRAALNGARVAREILGASGITLEYEAIRHMLNLETVDTYEGAYDVQTLVLGREITGIDGFR